VIKINLEQTGDKFLPDKLKSHAKPLLRMADTILSGEDENSASQRIALITFIIRVVSAFIALVSQILLARWLGTFEYGIYVAVWVAVIILSTITCIGFPSAVVRFIGEYRERGQPDLIHGVIRASMYISLLFSTLVAGVGCYILYQFPEIVTDYYVIPIFLAAICLPMLAVEGVMDCIARAFNWPKVAFLPTYILRPIAIILFAGGAFILGFPANAETTMWAAIIASLIATFVQFGVLLIKLQKTIPYQKPTYKIKTWVLVALPIFLVEGFYVLMTSVDVLFVSALMTPQDTAVYFATTKILALVHFVYFAVRASVSHRYSAFHTNGNQEAFQDFVQKTVSWTFWPSLLMAAFMAIFGKFFLMLFGSEFTSGSFILIVLLCGIVIRSSIGPAEALLVMAGRQKMCAGIYAITLSVNIALNIALIPMFGILGAAIATSIALVFESAALHSAAKRALDIHAFIIPRRRSVEEGIA
jgi:O-antigen/teichoic acid export membrane protein